MEDSRDELDRILDEGIAGYPTAVPLTGMEARILERIRLTAAPRANAPGWRSMSTYALVTMALAGFVVILVHHSSPGPSRIVLKTSSPETNTDAETAARNVTEQQIGMSHARRTSARGWRHGMAAAAKQKVFPTPSPLNPEERLLQLLARTASEEAAQTFDNFRRNTEPIEISPIAIAPLPGGDGQ